MVKLLSEDLAKSQLLAKKGLSQRGLSGAQQRTVPWIKKSAISSGGRRTLFVSSHKIQMPQYCIHIASREIASVATAATAKEYSAATAKIKRITWGTVVKAMLSPTAVVFVVLHRSIEQVSQMLALRGSCGHQLLLLSLNQRLIKQKKTEGTIGGSYCYR